MLKIGGLTIKQRKAIGLLAEGFTTAEVACRIGVCRQWLSHWVNHDPVFTQALENRANATQGVCA